LKLIDKGVTRTVAKVTLQFYRSRSYGTCVSYVWLSYQTIQETVDSLEMVVNFEAGVLQSGFLAPAMTAHSPVGLYPEKFGVKKKPKQ
jgi:hypothetical protein